MASLEQQKADQNVMKLADDQKVHITYLLALLMIKSLLGRFRSSIVFMLFEYLFIQREKEKLHSKIIQLERQLDMKQKLELEIQQLKGSLSVLKHIEDDEDVEVLKKVDALHMDLREKIQSLEDVEALYQTLIIKQRKSNDELQDARKELINVSIFFQIHLKGGQVYDSFIL